MHALPRHRTTAIRILLALLAVPWAGRHTASAARAQEPAAAGAGEEKRSDVEIAEIKRAEPVHCATDVLPILGASCTACHNAKDREGDLSLETPADIRKGGESGPAVVVGKGLESLPIRVSARHEKPFMPPKNNKAGADPLTRQELGLIKRWIDEGGEGRRRAGGRS